MLGVLKRRWKPKRAAGNNNNKNAGLLNAKPGLEVETPLLDKHRVPTSPRQIHPVCEEKLQLVAYDAEPPSVLPPTLSLHPPHLAPNICVEGGRIEFIKAPPPPPSSTVPPAAPSPAPQYDFVPLDVSPTPSEKADPAKESLEARILELEEALEAEKKVSQQERLLAAKLQRQLARREVAQRDVDRERRLRLDSECRLRNSASEAERCRARLAALQREFARMEETVRSMLQYKSRYDQLKQDKLQLTTAYENRIQHFQNALSKLNQENEALKKQLHTLEAAGAGEVQAALIERLRELEVENLSLSREGEAQRRQYERCLDDVANQVVRALLAQKNLREEIETLQQRVKDLETQNRTLTSLLLQQLTVVNSGGEARSKPNIFQKLALPAPGRPVSCTDVRLRVCEAWLPLQRPTSLSLESCCQYRHCAQIPQIEGKEEDGSDSPESANRDEGYSTMSSDVQGLTEPPRKGLEELKEASDETDSALPTATVSSSPDRLPEPEVVVTLSVSAANRHSFPPVRELLPWQHVMRSWSDSHLCLRLTSPNAALPLRHTTRLTDDDDSGSWCSGDWWDTDCVQHWLRLDETRSALQQQMEYDTAELEDWSMEEDLWRHGYLTHSQTLPSIQEAIAAEMEEDSNECMWNSSGYLAADGGDTGRWYNSRLISPGCDSWSSAGTNSEDGRSVNDCGNGGSKRSSTAMSSDSGDSPAIGTDFTRDFYRLVKFESTKSLASNSSKCQGDVAVRKGEIPLSMPLSSDREQTLQSVLHFIAEQQHYVLTREVLDTRHSEAILEEISPESSEDASPQGTAQKITQICEEVKRLSLIEDEEENSPEKRPESLEAHLNDYNSSSLKTIVDDKHPQISHSSVETSNINHTAICESVPVKESLNENNVPLDKPKNPDEEESPGCVKSVEDKCRTDLLIEHCDQNAVLSRTLRADISRSGLRPVPEEDEDHPMSESFTSSLSTPETVLKSQVPVIAVSSDSVTVFSSAEPLLVNGPKTISFHEKATSKDVIEELNRMIRKGEEHSGEVESVNTATNLDTACCCPTGWVHVERDIDFADPKTRANLLDVMLAASHSSSSSSANSSSSSANNSENEDHQDYQHLHRLHRFRRQKKASATREPLGALRCSASIPRPSIIGRDDFFVRYGAKEREAVASFDFLEELSTTSASGASSCDQMTCGAQRSDTSPSPSPDRGDRPLSLSDSCAASFSGSEPNLQTC